MSRLAGQLEDGLTLEDYVQLLLSARALVVFFDERLTGVTRHEEVDAERVDTKGVLEGIPGGIVRVAI
jgi:hypothetical protein